VTSGNSAFGLPVAGAGAQGGRPKTWQYVLRLIRFRPWLYLALGILETLFFGVFPQIVGWITYSFFNTLTGDTPVSLGVGGLIVLLVVTAIVRVGLGAEAFSGMKDVHSQASDDKPNRNGRPPSGPHQTRGRRRYRTRAA